MRWPHNVCPHSGWAVSAFFGYLKGVNNELALKHVPEVLPRNDSLAGPVGRRGDQVQHVALQVLSPAVVLAVTSDLYSLPTSSWDDLLLRCRLGASQFLGTKTLAPSCRCGSSTQRM